MRRYLTARVNASQAYPMIPAVTATSTQDGEEAAVTTPPNTLGDQSGGAIKPERVVFQRLTITPKTSRPSPAISARSFRLSGRYSRITAGTMSPKTISHHQKVSVYGVVACSRDSASAVPGA